MSGLHDAKDGAGALCKQAITPQITLTLTPALAWLFFTALPPLLPTGEAEEASPPVEQAV